MLAHAFYTDQRSHYSVVEQEAVVETSLYHKLLAVLQEKARCITWIDTRCIGLHKLYCSIIISSVRICAHHGTPMLNIK